MLEHQTGNQPPLSSKAEKAQALRRIAKEGAARVLHLVEVQDTESPPHLLRHFNDKYGEAATHFFRALHSYDERFANTSAPLGFAEMTRILGYAPETYTRWCKARKKTPDVHELREILLRSYKAADMFMGVSNSMYKTFSTAYGLGDKELAYPECAFWIFDDEVTGLPTYLPEPEGWELCKRELKRLGKPTEREGTEGCAARGRFGADVWASGVELFCSDPRYFQTDLDELTQSAQTVN